MRIADNGELEMLIEMSRKRIIYPLGCYPIIREFGGMLERLELKGWWKGREFFGFVAPAVPAQSTCFSFRHRADGITVTFAPDEWQSLREVFQTALALPELQAVLAELSMVYGEL